MSVSKYTYCSDQEDRLVVSEKLILYGGSLKTPCQPLLIFLKDNLKISLYQVNCMLTQIIA